MHTSMLNSDTRTSGGPTSLSVKGFQAYMSLSFSVEFRY